MGAPAAILDRNQVQSLLPRRAAERARAHRPQEPPLRIAMLAPPWIPVPPSGYGGIEAVLQLLCDALVERGHDVVLFCAPGSRSSATVHPLLADSHPESIERSLFEADHVARAFEAIAAAADVGDPFDVIHDHSGYTALAMAPKGAPPLVHTVHGPFDEHTGAFYSHHAAHGTLVCISCAQARMAPAGAHVEAVVYNPLDCHAGGLADAKDDYLLWLGRFAPEKGPQRAIRVARAAGRRLLLAGTVQPRFKRFFVEEVEPHIDGEAVRFVGEVAGERKQRLFARAHAFLMPIRWPEPFGMVMVEALAAGTPVLAFGEGAAPEIVEHGDNGFLVEDEEQMVAAVGQVDAIEPLCCRSSVVRRFAPDRVAAQYEAVYRRVVALRGGGPTFELGGAQAA
jgi:glycosyltransferase involved in cell wall biosynthesis